MKKIPFFSILLIITLSLAVLIPQFPHFLTPAASTLGITPDEALALFIVFMFLLAILFCVLFVLESVSILRAHLASTRRSPARGP